MDTPMAGDWIKMRTDLYRDPKVIMVASILGRADSDLAASVNQIFQRNMTITSCALRCATVGALVALWGVTRQRGKRNGDDLIIRGATLSVCDDITELPGFGEAIAQVGWAVQSEDGVVFPNFFETYNVEVSEESNAKAAERQRRYRERLAKERDAQRNGNVAQPVTTEKSREEKSSKRERESTPQFSPPTPAESAEYGQTIGMTGDECAHFHDHHTAAGWRIGNKPMRDWRAAMRTWKRNAARFDGRPAPQARAVVDPGKELRRRLEESDRRKAEANDARASQRTN